MVWDILSDLPRLPLLWNAFPLHPYQPGHPQSNRPPTKSEMELGRPFLQQLCALFPIQTIVAVGRKADAALAAWQFPHQSVRHPSHGGKRAFAAGLQAAVSSL